MVLYVLLHPLKLLPALLPVTPHIRCRVLRSAGIADISEAPGAIQAAVPAPVCGHEPNHSAFLVDVPSCRLLPLPPTRLQGGARWPLAASPEKLKWKKDGQLSFPACGQKCSVIFDSVVRIESTAASLPGEPKTKLPLGLCHQEEKNTCSALPLPTCGDSPPAQRPLRTAVPVSKQTHPWRQLFSSRMMMAEEQKAHPHRPKCTRRVQEIFQAQQRGGQCSTFLPSTAPQKGRRGVPGHLSAQPVPGGQGLGSWLSEPAIPAAGCVLC